MTIEQNIRIFEYSAYQKVRTIQINGETWWIAKDVCDILELENVSLTVARLDPDESRTHTISTPGGNQSVLIINESGLYHLLFSSEKPEAKKFRKWVTSEVLPEIRKTGGYGHRIPVFIRRFNANWDRIEKGYFSVIGELTIRIYGRLEHLGYYLEDYAPDKREIRPDVSVGKLFPKWLETKAPDKVEKYKTYMHLLPNNVEVHARQYENCVLEEFLEYVDTIWIKERAYEYFSERDPKALEFLPKMLPN